MINFQSVASLERFRFDPKKYGLVLVIAVFGVLGVILLTHSKAATTSAGIEAESGTQSGTSAVSDSSASGSSAIKFVQASSLTATMTSAINGATTAQTMDGLGASINVHSWDNGNGKAALDMLIDGAGVKVFRVVMEMTDWESTNDNSDPNTFNWNYYDPIYSGATSYDTAENGSNFGDLWNTIDYLHQKGIPDSQIILSYMGVGPSWNGGTTVTASQEDEWVEEVLSAAYYGYSHGHTFGVFSPDNEEDWGRNEGIVMSASVYAAAMNKLAGRMDTVGGMSNVRLLGPETSSVQSTYINAMEGYPALMAKIDHFDSHNYSGADPSGLSTAKAGGKDYWTSEFSDVNDFALDYLDAGSSGLDMWDGYDSVYNHAILNNLGKNPGNDAGPQPALIAYSATTKVYTPRKSFYQFGQLAKYIEIGSKSVDITSSNGNVDLEAYVNTADNSTTIVGQNNTGSAQVIGGTLKNTPSAGTFHYSETTTTENMAAGADVPIVNNTFKAPIAKGAFFTLTTLNL